MQKTLWGVWKKGTAKQQQPIEDTILRAHSCVACGSMFGNAGALASHGLACARTSAKVHNQLLLSDVVMAQLRTLNELAHQDEVVREPQLTAPGAQPAAKHRGQDRRIRRDVKFKAKFLRLFDRVRKEMEEAADERDTQPPTIKDVLESLAENGFAEPTSNCYKWLQKRQKIEAQYLDQKVKRIAKGVGAGRSSMIPVTEATVQAIVLEQRQRNLRVSRLRVKELLKSKAAELEPDAVAKLKFSNTFIRSAMRRMNLVIRRISSTKSVQNDGAAKLGRFFCRQLMELRETGACSFFPDQEWAVPSIKDSVFGFFPPEFIFTADEVPFNFCEEGKTVSGVGGDAAARTLTGTGKRFGTCVVISNGAGDLLRFVIIYKAGKTGLRDAEVEQFKKLPNVIVTCSPTSYITEDIWAREVIDGVVFKFISKRYGRDWCKRRYIFLSDNHSAHHTKKVLETCLRNGILPAFTPPNYTSHWSHIDDYVGTGSRALFYTKAQQFEEQYFQKSPEGNGALKIGERRVLCAKWWNEVWEELQIAEKKQLRVNAAKRVGLWVTSSKPADTSYLPAPIRFRNTAFQHFGEVLYDETNPGYRDIQSYQFGYKIGEDSKQEEAHDEDGYSEEEALVWRADEADENEDSEMGSDDEMDLVQKAMVRKHQRTGLRIVAQYDALDAAEGRRSRRNK